MKKYNWKPYNGTYEKIFYAVKTKDGVTHDPCYPNAGYFHVLDSKCRGVIDGKKVSYIADAQQKSPVDLCHCMLVCSG